MRTMAEIKAKVEELDAAGLGVDFFGAAREELYAMLPFDDVQDAVNDGVTAEQWAAHSTENTREAICKSMRAYLPFAKEKAENERGLSAARSMDHYWAWIWLLGEEERFGDVRQFDNYGRAHLEAIEAFLAEEDQA